MSSIAKVIEVIAQSEKSFDDAVKNALAEVQKSVSNVKSIWVENFSADVVDGKIGHYRVNAKVTFLVEGRK